ncbi:Conserved hypothetical protein [gamma proteobacterium HdN1]|nr:Conserved hypothetical protein [gamma proteobacterium HdN1]
MELRPMKNKLISLAFALALLFSLAVIAGLWGAKDHWRTPAIAYTDTAKVAVPWDAPDLLIESTSLSSLPRDLLEIPLLRDVLSEDFVFYYQNHPDRLGILGSLRRIAYEHELTLQDSFITTLFDEPATLAFWRDKKGKPTRAVLVLQRNQISRWLEWAAKVAVSDRQLKMAGSLDVGRESVPLYLLNYGYKKSLLFASWQDRLLLISDPEMLQGVMSEPSSSSSEKSESNPIALAKGPAKAAAALLRGEMPWPGSFYLPEAHEKHRISARADFLALGYQAFFPSVEGVSLLWDANGWKTQLAFRAMQPQPYAEGIKVWEAAPSGASLCAALPITDALPLRLLNRAGLAKQDAAQLASALNGPVAVCWYPDSHFYTPLLLGQVKSNSLAEADHLLADVFEKHIGSLEGGIDKKRFPVKTSSLEGGTRWSRVVSSRYGQFPASRLEGAQMPAESRYFDVSLAHSQNWVMFSLDPQLVDRAISTSKLRYPALSDALSPKSIAPLYIYPEKLAELVRKEVKQSLPRDREWVFRLAVETHLWPKLDKLAGYPPMAFQMPSAPKNAAKDAESWQWVPMEWNFL